MFMGEEESIDSPVTPEENELNESNISINFTGNSDALSNGSSSIAEEITDSLVITPAKDDSTKCNTGKASSGNSDVLSNGSSSNVQRVRTSIDDADNAGDSSTRNSTAKSNSTKSSQKVQSRYLGASTSSCHDFCKYGRKHSSEEKESRPWRKRVAKSLTTDQYRVEILVAGEQKKEKVANHKPTKGIKNHSPNLRLSLDSKSQFLKSKTFSDTDKVVNHNTRSYSLDLKPSSDTKSYSEKPKAFLDGEKVSKHKSSSDAKSHSSNQKPNPPTKSYSPKPKTSPNEEKVAKRKTSAGSRNNLPNLPSPDIKPYLRKSKASSVAKTNSNNLPSLPSPDIKPYLRKSKASSVAKTNSLSQNASSGKKNLLPKDKPSSTKKLTSPEPPEIVKSVVFFPSKDVQEPVPQGSSSDVRIPTKNTTSPSKQRSSPVNLKPVKVSKPSSSSENTDGAHGKGKRNIGARTGLTMTLASKASAKKVFSPIAATLSPKPIKIASIKSRKPGNLNRLRRVKSMPSEPAKVSEKTLHVIETEITPHSMPDDNAISSLSSPSSAKSLSHAEFPFLSLHEEEDNTELIIDEADQYTPENEPPEIEGVPPVEETPNRTLTKSRAGLPQDKDGFPMKLKFRSGKVVDFPSPINSPRRLRFRRAKVSGREEGKGDSRRKTFKRNAANNGGPDAEEQPSEKVVLKHQDVQDKKDAQGLLNNVIEETATKLAESRKSKVKALVGAFETVISLQETKPSSQAAS